MEQCEPIELEAWSDARPPVTQLLDGLVGELVGRNRARDLDMVDYWEEVFEAAVKKLKQLRKGGNDNE